MRKLTILPLFLGIFILSACFRSAGADTPTAQAVSDIGGVEVAVVATTEVPPTEEVIIEEEPPTETPEPSPTLVEPSPTLAPTLTPPTVSQKTAGVEVAALGQGGAEEAIPLGEVPTQEVVVVLPTDTPVLPTSTPIPTDTPLPTSTPISTNTPLPSATATDDQPTPTRTTIPRTPFAQDQNTSLNLGQGGQEVAQEFPTATTEVLQQPVDPNQQLLPNQLTATAIIQGATATQAAVETIAAGGDPNAGVVPGQDTTQGGGQQVIVVTSTPVGQIQDCEYMVGIGETLSAIARRYNLTINDLAIKNNITNPDLIQAGYPIIIPGCGQLPSAATTVPTVAVNLGQGGQVGGTLPNVGQGGAVDPGATNNANGPFVYTVQVGDNIYRLSLTYGVTMREILNANPTVTNMHVIREGQEIVIPGPPTQTISTTTQTINPTPQGAIIVTATPFGAGAGGAEPVQPQIVQPTQALPFFTPTFTPDFSAQG